MRAPPFLSHKSKERKSRCWNIERRMARCWTVAWNVGAERWSFVSKSASRERKNVEERRNYSDSPKRRSGIFLSSRSDGGGGGGDSFWLGKNGGHVRRIFGWIFDPPFVAHRETIANLSPPTSFSLLRFILRDDAFDLLRDRIRNLPFSTIERSRIAPISRSRYPGHR